MVCNLEALSGGRPKNFDWIPTFWGVGYAREVDVLLRWRAARIVRCAEHEVVPPISIGLAQIFSGQGGRANVTRGPAPSGTVFRPSRDYSDYSFQPQR